MNDHETPATVESSLKLGNGFDANERDDIVAGWDRLTSRLASFPDGTVELELSVKERATPSQRTVLAAWITEHGQMVATSRHADINSALIEVRDDLIRQLSDTKNRTEPSNSRTLRDTIRNGR